MPKLFSTLLLIAVLLPAVGMPDAAYARQTIPRKVLEQGQYDVIVPKRSTRRIRNARIDSASGLTRARYAVEKERAYYRPERFLKEEASSFGWSSDVSELDLIRDERRERSRHVTYEQTFRGIPVANGRVRVNMDREGRVSMVTSSFEPIKAQEETFDVRPALNAEDAREKALGELARGRGRVGEPRLVIHDPAAPRLAWEMTLWPESEPAEYKVWVDARSGDILAAFDQALSKDDHGAGHRQSPRVETEGSEHAADVSVYKTDGSGYVFDPDPLFATGAGYAPPYVDNNDQTNAELDAARTVVALRDITQDADGKWVLQGPFVQIVGYNTAGTTVYDPPAADGPNDFFFDRSDERFEAVNVYYHVDASQRYVQSLGILDVQHEGVEINPHGITRDDSFYYPDRNMIMFGSGGVDDAEDPSVVIHEYGHALLNAAAPGLLTTLEGRALHEGFSDYWQASYYRNLVESGRAMRDDWRWVFLWDSGEGQIWNGRYLDHQGVYPGDVCVASTSGAGCSVHDDGRMWATTLMEVWDAYGRSITDHLVLLSHYYLASPVTFADAAQAVIQADFDYYGGVHAGQLIDIFSSRGLVNASQYGPIVDHEALLSTERGDVPIVVEATVRGVSASIQQVEMNWFTPSTPEQVVVMNPVGGDLYRGELVLPVDVDTVHYYLSARDQINNVTLDPAGAPASVYSFVVGVDEGPPLLSHDPVEMATFLEWPVRLAGTAEDNFGVASVTVVWELFSPDGVSVATGTDILSEANGTFDQPMAIPLSLIENGSTVEYAVEAVDASVQKNAARLPEAGRFAFSVTAGAVVRSYDFDAPVSDLDFGGQWESAAPGYGTRVTPGGGAVAATGAESAYTADASVSYLQLPTLNLARIEQTFLRFWHYVDTEAEGRPDPAETSGILYDGGFIEVRSGAQPEWEVLQPEGAYNGTLSAVGQNPMAGRPAFGGFSHGWRRVSAALPRENGVDIRFVFATNQGNTAQADRFAGWLIENVSIGSTSDMDQGQPVFTEAPPSLQIFSTQAASPTVDVTLTDDLGIQDAWMEWELDSGSAQAQGIVRMTQSPDDLTRFSAATDFLLAPQPGDELTVWLRAADVGANEISSGPFALRFRLFGSHEALRSVWANGNWEALEEGWIFRSQPSALLSGLVLNPRDTEINAAALSLVLDHEPKFGDGSAGLVEVSSDNGATWQLLTPEGGYPGTARLDPDNPLNDRKAFIGSDMRMESLFDLSAWTGDQLQVRFLATSEEGGSLSQYWRLFAAEFKAQTDDMMFEQATRFELDAAFPNPFDDRTRLTWSLERSGTVRLEVYDSIGRRVATLVDGYYDAGSHAVTWDGAAASAGVYFVRLQADGRQAMTTVVRSGR